MEASREAGAGAAREADVAPAPSEASTRRRWAPANPGPLGLGAFAMTTLVLSLINANLVGVKGAAAVLPLAAAYGGVVQILAGMWEFRTGNTFGAVAFSSYGAFWVGLYIILKLPALAVTHQAVSLYLWGWAILTVLLFVASLRTTGALAILFVLLTITFFLLAIGNASLVGSTSLTNNTIKLGGWFGIATAAVAFYTAFAGVVASTFGRDVVPVYPLHR